MIKINKKAFTLIELLAVILILGIIALIAIPTINNIIKEAKRGTYETSIKNIISTAEQQCEVDRLKGMNVEKTYVFSEGMVSPNLEYKGNIASSGEINVDNNCNIKVYLSNDEYILYKDFKQEDMRIIDSKKICTANIIADSSTYTSGDKYVCNPGDGINRDFYVVAETNETLTLIMDRNIGGNISYCANNIANNSCKGDRILSYLTITTSNWQDVVVGIPEAGMLAEASGFDEWTINDGTSELLPNFLKLNLACEVNTCTEIIQDEYAITGTTNGYWTITPFPLNIGSAWFIESSGRLSTRDVRNTTIGLRPVITILKSTLK